ncbi:SRPBCC family protein [Luteolibacter sp. Populi]|uniref:SRPBCC family protein n=1 Tax=Luteolibacter sp. Populi TaxID=3230487 RepID=UPI0034669FEC
MLRKILLGLAAILLILIGVIAMQPPDFKVERSATVSAPPATVFGQVNDFHKWEAWSPWEKLDPALKRTFEGPESGVGAKYGWVGNSKVGEGKMTIEDSRPAELVKIKLEFIKPMAATSDTVFTFTPEGPGTKVTWTMSGKNNFMAKAFGLFMNMDKMVGGDFEKGLAQMKAVAEAPAKP